MAISSVVNIHQNAGGFVIAAGAILGLCAGLLWTAQGSLMLAYPTEDQKGKFIGIFWSIFNLGGVVGAAVSFARNFDSEVCFTPFFVYVPLIHLWAPVRRTEVSTALCLDATILRSSAQFPMAHMYAFFLISGIASPRCDRSAL
jgi:hypothetical protein